MSDVFDLSCDLISRPSVTPDDAGCQPLLTSRLEPLGFQCEQIDFEDVVNLWAVHGTSGPLLAFLGHTDVVPTGPLEEWTSPPFTPTVRDGLLYGRGSADMKGSVAAMTIALERFVKDHPNHNGRVALLLTSDEEGPSINGIRKVIPALQERGDLIDYCLVGEPSSSKRFGDIIKNGRRGSLNGRLKVIGEQGHVAYPQLAKNPIHLALPALSELAEIEWDQGNDHFPPTSFQIPNIEGGTGAENVIPGVVNLQFNFRYCTETTEAELKKKVTDVLDRHGFDYTIDWRLSGEPFLTEAGALVDACNAAIENVLGQPAELSTSGGTSDGRFVAPTGAQVLELGPINATIHQINECVDVESLDLLEEIYYQTLVGLLVTK